MAAERRDPGIPDLSIVIAVQQDLSSIAACLTSLDEQIGIDSTMLECLVVDGSRSRAIRESVRQYPHIGYFPLPSVESLPLLHEIGIAAARGRLIGITEGHCTFPRDWAKTAIALHEANPCAAIGGVVEPGTLLGLIDWALYLCDYASFLPPLTPGETANLPGNNVVFDRSVLGHRDKYTSTGFWKTFLCRQLIADGQRLVLDPRLVVRYHRHLRFHQLVIRRYHHGRCYGAMRAAQISHGRRVLYAISGPFMPGLLLLRIAREVWPKRHYRRQLLLSLPLSAVAIGTWSIAEWIGNLFGQSESCNVL